LRRKQVDPEAAEEAYKKAIELNPNDADVYASYGMFRWSRNGNTSDVAVLYRKAYELDPKHELAQIRLAQSLEASGQFEEALEVRKSFVAENPERAIAHRQLGFFYLHNLGQYYEAIIEFRKQLALDRNATNVLRALADAYINLGDTEKAIWWIERYLNNQQDPLQRARWMSWKFKLTGDVSAREQTVLQGLNQYPKDGELIGHLTDLYLAVGQPEKVLLQWEKAYPTFFAPVPEVNWSSCSVAKDMARVLTATGELEQANRLIVAALAAAKPVLFIESL